MTTADVVCSIIIPETTACRLSYAELPATPTASETPDASSPSSPAAFGQADFFVSHAWRCPFVKLVGAIAELDQQLQARGSSSPPLHWWVDIFAITQHKVQAQEVELQALGHVVAGCRQTVAVLEPWHSPQLVNRLWCLFELMKTMQVIVRVPLEPALAQAVELSATYYKPHPCWQRSDACPAPGRSGRAECCTPCTLGC